jgi:hypothetical protein
MVRGLSAALYNIAHACRQTCVGKAPITLGEKIANLQQPLPLWNVALFRFSTVTLRSQMKKTLRLVGLVLFVLVALNNLSLPIPSQAFSGAISATKSTIAASPNTVVANGIAITTIIVTVRNNNNRSLSGIPVTLSADRSAGIMISPASRTTTSSGTATFTAKSTVEGSVTFSAVAGGITITRIVIITFTAPTPTPSPTPTRTLIPTATYTYTPTQVVTPTATSYTQPSASQSAISIYPYSVAADSTTAVNITVIARDSAGNRLPGRIVQVYIDPSIPADRAAGVKIDALNSVTDESGLAYFQARSSQQGQVTLRAIIDNITLDGNGPAFFNDPSWPTPTPFVTPTFP